MKTSKIKWEYLKKEKKWVCTHYIHPTIEITRQSHGYHNCWWLFFSGRVTVEIPFDKIESAKKAALLILNG